MKQYTKNKVSGNSGIVISHEPDDNQEIATDLSEFNPDETVTLTQSKQNSGFLSWSTYPKIIREPLAAIRWIALTKGAQWVCIPLGLRFLSKAQTEAFLQSCQLILHPANPLLLPEVVDLLDPRKQYFPQTPTTTESVRVWNYASNNSGSKQLPYGGIVLENKVLCYDSDYHDFHRNVRHRRKRAALHVKILIAPWSHFLDGYIWGGYYDYLILLVGKLCRMKDALPEAVFTEATVAYPLFNTPYESEYLSLLGIEPERVMDSRRHRITFDRCILGDIGHWFYPNASDITLIRKYILDKMPESEPYVGSRIYISRAGRRCIRNERELVRVLKKYDFQIIEDTPRSIAEQVAIYRNAQFIIGPHGASFSNIIWCRPGTHLFELFSVTYMPEHFRFLAELLKVRYSAYHYGALAVDNDNRSKGLEDSIYVDVTEINRCLEKLFGS